MSIGTWKNVSNDNTKDKQFVQFELELNRRLRQYFNKYNVSGGSGTFSDIILTGMSGDIITTTGVKLSIEELDEELYKIMNADIKVVVGTDTLTAADRGTIHCNAAGAITLNLPTAVGNKFLSYHITNINAGTVTIDADGAETIHSDSTFDLYQDETIVLQSNNVGWWMK